MEIVVGVEHKYKMNPNAANIYESLLLENTLLAAGHHLVKSLFWHT
jgi:hypothetical protein